VSQSLLARAEAIFHSVMELPADQRAAAIDRACAGDQPLHREVNSLVDAACSGTFLSTPALHIEQLWAVAKSTDAPDPLLGTTCDEYHIMQRLGAGGMGVVYRARQDNPRRDVALKVMRPGLISAEVIRRFENEANILGQLQHPGIAQVYRAGRLRTQIGTQPYFVMELVEGTPLLEFLARHPLSTEDRLELVARICDAVQHAHSKGVIHRDLKPANILIVPMQTAADSLPWQPKVLDFGVARLNDQSPLTILATLGTSAGEIVGTLAYMSPEQVDIPASATAPHANIDTRADVYALGVILYQVMSGRLPIELSGVTIAQAAPRIVNQAPRRLGHIAAACRGDIEIIAAKALEKDRDRRYATAAALAEDLRRVIAHVPIVARPASAGYQLRKFAQRNTALVAAASLAVVLLIAGIVGTSIGLVQAREALKLAEQREREAKDALAQAERTTGFLTSMLASANPTASRGRQITVLELVDQTAARAAYDLADLPVVEGRTRVALARTYLSLFALAKANAEAERALTLAQQTFGASSVEYSEALADKASILIADGKHALAQDLCGQVLRIRLARLPQDHPKVAHARVQLGKALANGMKVDDAEREFDLARPILERSSDSEFVTCVTIHADTILRRPLRENRLADAQKMLTSAPATLESRGASADPDRATLLMSLGGTLLRQGLADQAEAAFRQAYQIRENIFPAGHPALLAVRLRIVTAVRDQKRLAEARDLAVALVADSRRSIGTDSGELSNTLALTADLHTRLNEHAAATPLLEDYLRIANQGGDGVIALVATQLLGQNYLETKRFAEAERLFRGAVATLDQPGRRVASAASYRGHLADAIASRGDIRKPSRC
jgi:serine/threonine protein kinase/tetratricopeptide (TPR) repeat protein